ncbi:MAG TPA: RidA family protein [bacterium]|nr:RidA family protein [bacterium]
MLLIGCGPNDNFQLSKQIIESPDAPAAIGPYSQAVKVGNTLYCSGQIAIDPKSGELVTESIEAETRQVLENLGAVLKAAGMDFSDVVRATVFMSDMENYQRINAIYGEYFTENPPARAAVQVANLPRYVNVEISCIAVKAN